MPLRRSCCRRSPAHPSDRLDEQPPDVASAVPAVAHHLLPRDDDVGDVAGRSPRRARCSGPAPAVRGLSSRTATRSADAPAGDHPAVVPAERAVAVERGHGEQVGGRRTDRVRRLSSRSCISTPRTSSNRSMTACWSRAQGQSAPRRRAAGGPGRCRRRGRARWSGRSTPSCRAAPSSSMSSSVRWVACTSGRRGPEQPRARQQLGRGAAVEGLGTRRSRPAARTGARAAADRRPPRRRRPRRGRRTAPPAPSAPPHRSARCRRRTGAATRSAQASAVPSENRSCTSSSGTWPLAMSPPAR